MWAGAKHRYSLSSANPVPREEEALQLKVDLIFMVRRELAVIKEPFPSDMLIPAASKMWRKGADRQDPGSVAGPGSGSVQGRVKGWGPLARASS